MGGGARPSGDSASTDLAPSANEPSRFVVRPLQEKVGVSAKGTARRPGGRVHPFIGDGSEVHLKGPVQVRSNPHRAEGFGRANVALKPVRNGGLKGEEDQTMDASSDGSVREENLSQRSASADLVSGSDVSKALQNSPSDRISSGTSLAGNSGAGGLAAPGFVSPSAPLDLPADNDKSQTEEDLSGVRVGDGSEEQTRGEEPGKLSLLENASEMQVDQGEEMRSSFEFDAPARHGVGPEGEGSFRQPGEASKDSTGGPTTPGAESIRGHLDPALPMAVSEELSEESRRSDSDGSIREGAPLLEETGLDVGKGGRAGDGGSERSTDFEEGARPLSEVARSYQLEVLAQARKENTIAFLETGSGKTLIAVSHTRPLTPFDFQLCLRVLQ